MTIHEILAAAADATYVIPDDEATRTPEQAAVHAVRSGPFAAMLPSYLEFVGKVTDLDTRMSVKSGTFSARKAEKRAELVTAGAPVVVELTAVEAELTAIKGRHELAVQAVEDAITELLKADKADVTTELSVLQAERTELVTGAAALATILTSAPKAVTAAEIGIGKVRASGSTSTGGSPTVKSGEHYRIKGGVAKAYTNSTFSGLAFYAFRKDEHSPTAQDLTAALAEKGITELSKPWEVELTLNGVTKTIGHRVLEPTTETATEAIGHVSDTAGPNGEPSVRGEAPPAE